MAVLEVQWGSIAELIAAAAALASTVLTIFALKIARNANATAETARREADGREREALDSEQARDKRAQAREHERDARELDRDRRNVASSIQAWWVVVNNVWGVLVTNTAATSAVFHNVEIGVAGNSYTDDPIVIECLPPGIFFIESKSPWPLPQPLANLQPATAIMRSAKHRVERIEFTDPLGDRWTWHPDHGLAKSE